MIRDANAPSFGSSKVKSSQSRVGLSNIFQGMAADSLKDAIEVSYLPKTSFKEGTPDYFNYVKELHL